VATKKQRRRREKERRHEYEMVYVDETGEEVEVDEADSKPAKTGGQEESGKSGGQRKVEPPSWNRVLRRGAIFAPFILIFVYLTRPKDASAAAVILPAILLLVLLVPFMYAVDSVVYRSHQKRLAKRGGSPPKSK
jgi:hypothetical protein